MVGLLEQKLEKSRFTRVDSDVIDNLIVKEDEVKEVLEADKQEALSTSFKSQLPKLDKVEFAVNTQALGETAAPVTITQSEYMRRMKDMAQIQQGMSFYGEMPDMFNLILNTDHKLIKTVLEEAQSACKEEITPLEKEIETIDTRKNELTQAHKDKKEEEIPTAEKDELKELEDKRNNIQTQKANIYANFAKENKVIRQLIDLALLQNNMLKGESLNQFVQRSINLIK